MELSKIKYILFFIVVLISTFSVTGYATDPDTLGIPEPDWDSLWSCELTNRAACGGGGDPCNVVNLGWTGHMFVGSYPFGSKPVKYTVSTGMMGFKWGNRSIGTYPKVELSLYCGAIDDDTLELVAYLVSSDNWPTTDMDQYSDSMRYYYGSGTSNDAETAQDTSMAWAGKGMDRSTVVYTWEEDSGCIGTVTPDMWTAIASDTVKIAAIGRYALDVTRLWQAAIDSSWTEVHMILTDKDNRDAARTVEDCVQRLEGVAYYEGGWTKTAYVIFSDPPDPIEGPFDEIHNPEGVPGIHDKIGPSLIHRK